MADELRYRNGYRDRYGTVRDLTGVERGREYLPSQSQGYRRFDYGGPSGIQRDKGQAAIDRAFNDRWRKLTDEIESGKWATRDRSVAPEEVSTEEAPRWKIPWKDLLKALGLLPAFAPEAKDGRDLLQEFLDKRNKKFLQGLGAWKRPPFLFSALKMHPLLRLLDLWLLLDMLGDMFDDSAKLPVYDMTGWTLVCGAGHDGRMAWSGPGCGTGYSISKDTWNDWVNHTSKFDHAHFQTITGENGSKTNWLFDETASWAPPGVPVGSPKPDPRKWIDLEPDFEFPPMPKDEPAAMREPAPHKRGRLDIDEPPSWLDPWFTPIMQPDRRHRAVPYAMIPYRKDNLQRVQSERPVRGYIDPFRPRDSVDTTPEVNPVTVIEANGDPGIPRGTDVHENRPPRKGEKERKVFVAGRTLGVFEKIFGGITEGIEFIEILWKSIPKDKRSRIDMYWTRGPDGKKVGILFKKPPPQQMLKDIYRNWQHIDVAKATNDFVEGQLKDMLFGRAGKQMAKTARRYRLPGGLQRGLAI